jgi:putative RecB family exonuclease
MSDKLKVFNNAFELTDQPKKTERIQWLDDLEGGTNPYEVGVEKLIAEGKIERSKFTLPLPYLSVSQVECYLRCPMQYEWRYIKGIKSAPGIAMVQGSTLHKGLETGYKYMKLNKKLPPLEMIMDEYSGAFTKGLTSDVVLEEGEDEKFIRTQGETFLKDWHANKAVKIKPVAVESKFITMFGGVPTVGAIDIIDRTEVPLSESQRWENKTDDSTDPLLDVIVDNKFLKKAYSEADAKNSLQMSLYAHATGIGRQRYDLYVKSKIPKLTEMLTSRNAKDVKWAAKTFAFVADSISKGIFPMCSPSSWGCSERFCGYWASCRGKDE